jgi:uncharacterized protein YerC
MSYRRIDKETRYLILRDTRPHKVIAQEYGVHKDTVGRIKRQAFWETVDTWHTHLRSQDKAD